MINHLTKSSITSVSQQILVYFTIYAQNKEEETLANMNKT